MRFLKTACIPGDYYAILRAAQGGRQRRTIVGRFVDRKASAEKDDTEIVIVVEDTERKKERLKITKAYLDKVYPQRSK